MTGSRSDVRSRQVFLFFYSVSRERQSHQKRQCGPFRICQDRQRINLNHCADDFFFLYEEEFPCRCFFLHFTSTHFWAVWRSISHSWKKKRRAERVRKRVFVRAETCVLFYDPKCDRFAVNHCGSFVATRKGRWGGDGRGAAPLMDCGGENDLLDAPKARDKYRYDSMGIRGKRSDRVVCPKNPAYSREDIRSRSAHLNEERGSRAARITPVGFRRPARAVVHFRFFRPATRQQQQRSLFDKSAKPTGDSALSLSLSRVSSVADKMDGRHYLARCRLDLLNRSITRRPSLH